MREAKYLSLKFIIINNFSPEVTSIRFFSALHLLRPVHLGNITLFIYFYNYVYYIMKSAIMSVTTQVGIAQGSRFVLIFVTDRLQCL